MRDGALSAGSIAMSRPTNLATPLAKVTMEHFYQQRQRPVVIADFYPQGFVVKPQRVDLLAKLNDKIHGMPLEIAPLLLAQYEAIGTGLDAQMWMLKATRAFSLICKDFELVPNEDEATK